MYIYKQMTFDATIDLDILEVNEARLLLFHT